MKSILLASILMAGYSATSQNPEQIKSIEFSSLTRGYQEHVVFTSDSMKHTRTQAGQPKFSKSRALKKSEWQDMIKVAQKINLKEISELKSPTMKRAFDGARQSSITITTESKQVYTHSFDDEKPHEKLRALLEVLLKKRGK